MNIRQLVAAAALCAAGCACAEGAWYLDLLNVPALHAQGITGKGVKVGVVDTGSHGIGVRSIIASKRIGIAPDCDLLYRSTPDNIKGSLAGVWYCATNGCQVINMSFSYNVITATPEVQRAFEDEMRKICRMGVILVCSNSNNGDNELIECPAVVPELIAIGGIARDGTPGDLKKNMRMDFCAYGIDVPVEKNVNGDLKTASGTSFSAPMATAIVALLLQQNPKLTRDEVYDILKRNVKKLADRRTKDFGWGLVQACTVPADYRRQAEIDAERARRIPLKSIRLTNPELAWNAEKEWYEVRLPRGASLKLTYESTPANATDPKAYWYCGNLKAVNRMLDDDVLRMKDKIVTMRFGKEDVRMDHATIQAMSSDFKPLAVISVSYDE